MFQLILKAVKKVLGQQELIRILRLQKFYDSNSFFLECKTKELFNAMAKIVVTRDDNAMDYTDLYDLVFHDAKSTQTLEYIDAENLQGLLLLRGVDEFTKRFLDTISSLDSGIRILGFNNDGTRSQTPVTRQRLDSSNLYSVGFPLLTNHLLRHFTKVQLEQLVETITSLKLKTKFLEVVLRTYDCLKCLSDSFMKKLLLHEEESGFIMIQLSLEAVERMLTYLSKESQEEVKQQQWKDNAPSMDTFSPSTMEQPNNGDIMSTARRWTNVLRFYLKYGSEVQLKEFVKTVTFLRNIGVERRSVWSYILEHCHKEEKIK